MFDIPEELRMLQATARRFVNEELMPLEDQIPEGADLPPALEARLKTMAQEIGLWALAVPQEYGGGGVGALGQILVTEESAKCLVGMGVFGGNPPPNLYLGTPEQKDKYLYPVIRGEKFGAFALTEPTGGSDPGGNMQTTAVRDGDNWVINGRKCFISRGDKADFVVVYAVTDKEKRQHGGISAFVVERDTPGFIVVRTIPTMGVIAPAELEFQDCVVPDSQRIGDVGHGFVQAQRLLGTARMGIGARAVGVAERLLGMGVEYAKTRVTFGQPLAERQAVQMMLADSAIEIDCCRWTTYHAADMADRGQDTRLQDSMIKVFASEMMGRVADRVMQIYGGWGYTKDFPIERFYREARLWRIVEGPNEVHRWVIARTLLKGGLAPLRAI